MNEKEYLEYIQKWKEENKELIQMGKVRKLFSEYLPKKYGFGANKDRFVTDWEKSIGYTLYFIYYNRQEKLSVVSYNSKLGQVNVEFNDGIYEIKCDALLACKIGKKLLNVHSGEFKYNINDVLKDEKRNLIITDRIKIKSKKYYKYICNNPECGFECGEHYKSGEYKKEHWVQEVNLISGVGCACCTNQIVVPNINSIVAKEETQWMIPYFKGGYDEAKRYNRKSNLKIKPRCPLCGDIKDKEITINELNRDHSIRCICNNSIKYPNRFMGVMLNEVKNQYEKFETEYSPDWASPKKYDFYIPSMNLIIEMDGEFHFKDNTMSGQTKEESKSIDNWKDDSAIKHGIEIIRINCDYRNNDRFEYIKKNVLKSRLNDFIDLDNIDWDIIHENAENNIVEVVCNIRKENPLMSAKDIGNLVNIKEGTVWKYIRYGIKIGIHDGKQEKLSKGNRITNNKEKMIVCLDTTEVFKSSNVCAIEFTKRHGLNFTRKGISTACHGGRKDYRKMKFKYIEDLTQEEYIKYDIANKLKEIEKAS